MTRILCFGDSITFGYTDPEGGWTQRLHNKLANIYVTQELNPLHEVMSLGISGETADGLLKRMQIEMKARLGATKNNGLILLAIGTNDSVYSRNGESAAKDADTFKKEILKLITIARTRTDNIGLVGLLPCEESKMQPMPWSTTGKSYSNSRIKEFNDVLRVVSEEEDVYFCDMFADMEKRDVEKYLFDGIHPNPVGHQYIADRLYDWVAEKANGYDATEK